MSNLVKMPTALRGKKPTEVKKRLKALFYGKAGVGKTTCAIQMPSPYLIDTERGCENAQYIEILEAQGGAIFQTTDYDELVTEIKLLLTTQHNYKTLVIDPLTTIYESLLDKAAQEPKGTEFGRHYNKANSLMKRLLNLLLRLDMNVIVTSHAKTEYAKDLTVVGQTFDCYKKLDYLFDMVIEVEKCGAERFGIVKKSRFKTFPVGMRFSFDYMSISEKYGRDVIERDVVAHEFIDKVELLELVHLIEVFKVPEETVDKWLDKAQASSLDELPRAYAQKCIAFLKEQINATKAKEIA